jgi:hypothetical protein
MPQFWPGNAGVFSLSVLWFSAGLFSNRCFVFLSGFPGISWAEIAVKEKMHCPVFLSAPKRENGNKREHKREQAFFKASQSVAQSIAVKG